MAASDPFHEFVVDQLSGLGAVRVRRMFGGGGVYVDAIMFGLISDDTLYLKADEQTCKRFQAEGMGPFVYRGGAKPMTMSYWQVPERLYDEPEELLSFARDALGVARRAAAEKAKKPAPKRRGKAAPAGKPARG